mgnify:FL=1
MILSTKHLNPKAYELIQELESGKLNINVKSGKDAYRRLVLMLLTHRGGNVTEVRNYLKTVSPITPVHNEVINSAILHFKEEQRKRFGVDNSMGAAYRIINLTPELTFAQRRLLLVYFVKQMQIPNNEKLTKPVYVTNLQAIQFAGINHNVWRERNVLIQKGFLTEVVTEDNVANATKPVCVSGYRLVVSYKQHPIPDSVFGLHNPDLETKIRALAYLGKTYLADTLIKMAYGYRSIPNADYNWNHDAKLVELGFDLTVPSSVWENEAKLQQQAVDEYVEGRSAMQLTFKQMAQELAERREDAALRVMEGNGTDEENMLMSALDGDIEAFKSELEAKDNRLLGVNSRIATQVKQAALKVAQGSGRSFESIYQEMLAKAATKVHADAKLIARFLQSYDAATRMRIAAARAYIGKHYPHIPFAEALKSLIEANKVFIQRHIDNISRGVTRRMTWNETLKQLYATLA